MQLWKALAKANAEAAIQARKAGAHAGADPQDLAADISVALLTTMWGLIVAILSLFAYFFFKNRFNALVADCHGTAENLINASIQTVNADAHLAKIPEGIAV